MLTLMPFWRWARRRKWGFKVLVVTDYSTPRDDRELSPWA
jgi:hypothetical protein